MALPATSSLPGALHIKQVSALSTALYFTHQLPSSARALACRSSVCFALIYCHFLPTRRRPSPSVTINSNGKQIHGEVTVTARQPKTPLVSPSGRLQKQVYFLRAWFRKFSLIHALGHPARTARLNAVWFIFIWTEHLGGLPIPPVLVERPSSLSPSSKKHPNLGPRSSTSQYCIQVVLSQRVFRSGGSAGSRAIKQAPSSLSFTPQTNCSWPAFLNKNVKTVRNNH